MLTAYLFSFNDGTGKRIAWTRYGNDMEATLALAKRAALADYPEASGWLISRVEG